MKWMRVNSTMSSNVVHISWGSQGGNQPSSSGLRKEVKDLGKLEQNEKDWAERRARFRVATGATSASMLASNAPDDVCDDDGPPGLEPLADDDNTIHVQIPPANAPFAHVYRHLYLRYLEPAVPFRRYDPRTWQDRIHAREKTWARILPNLTNAYIEWCNTGRSDIVPEAGTGCHVFQIDVVRECTFETSVDIIQKPGEDAAVALGRVGLLPCVPSDPTIAVSIDLLDFYYRLRRHAPRLGIQQFVKALCDRHDRAYHPYLRDQFDLAFNVYLAMRRELDTRLKIVLDRSSPNWRVKNSCPACRYKLDDEPELVIPGFFAVDGNFSMKRSAAAGTADPRKFVSDYKIDDESIDLYANEVKTRTRVTRGDNDSDEAAHVDVLNEPGEPGDDAPPTPCTIQWKASKAEQQKIAPEMFDQTGWYVALCRHGLVLWYCEMRRSGELAKYPLGTFARIMDAGLTPLTGAADIGCALQGTLARSCLGERARTLGLRIRMNAFHGYGHNRLCQVAEHPLYIEGFGLEELETCERFFSRSNWVAGIVRHATHFHYSQAINIFLTCWDEEKYAALSTFLCNNIIQAQDIIDTFEPTLNEFKASCGLTDAAIEAWRVEEKEYLESLKTEPKDDVLAIDYIEALQELAKAQAAAEDARIALTGDFIVLTPEDMVSASRAKVAKQATKSRKAHATLVAAIANVEALETALGVEVQWHPDSAEYKATLEKIRLRNYMRAVDRLELLMLQRMFELAKTHAFGTGYKMREAIGKNIKARSKAISTAVRNYNQAAQDLEPPAPLVDFTKLMEWTELQEFDLLRLVRRGDVRDRAWSQPVNREAAAKHYKILRAREELVRCKIEVQRLVTAIRDEEAHLDSVLARLREQGHPLVGELERLRLRRVAVNVEHNARFARLARRPGMAAHVSASLLPGTRAGGPATSRRVPHDPSPQLLPDRASSRAYEGNEGEDSGGELDDEHADQLLAVQDYLGHLE